MKEQRLKEIISKQLGITVDSIKLSDRLVEDLGADSLDVIELVMEIEQQFNIEIEDEEYNDAQTVGEIATLIESKVDVRGQQV